MVSHINKLDHAHLHYIITLDKKFKLNWRKIIYYGR